ncbi:MAG: hypothetical protein RIR96_657 [Bacteroidota bacterium]
MKNAIRLFIGLFLITLITQNFQCGRNPRRLCDEYIRDTIYAPFDISTSGAQTISVLDTLFLTCRLNDTIRSLNGLRFIKKIENATVAVQGYKVVDQGGSYGLNYANIEFNPIVIKGQFRNGIYSGINLLYERIQPYNDVKLGLVAGQPGLYLFTVQSFANYYEGDLFIEGNDCTSFHLLNKLNQSENQSFNWNNLGIQGLELIGYPGYEISNRNNPNHFFVRVLP